MAIIGAVAVPHPPIILPEIGKGEERRIAATTDAYQRAAKFISQLAPDTIVLTSPHAVAYQDYFHIAPGKEASGNFSRFGVPSVTVHADYDTVFTDELSTLAERQGFPRGRWVRGITP